MKLKKAKCERTGEEIDLIDGFFVAEVDKGEWFFVSMNAPEKHGDYSIRVSQFIKSPEELIDWIAHLDEKTWFNANKFISFFTKLKAINEF